jgi:outer membrane protein OmpA-like peptidoglycan-associated protein
MAEATTAPLTERDDNSMEKWLLIAIAGSLLLHVLIFFWFSAVILDMGRPMVDPIDPPRFRLEQARIDPKYLQEFSEQPQGHTTEASREPINLDIGDVVSFSGSLEAPSIPVPRLSQEVPSSLSAGDLEIPQAAFSALPLQQEGNIPQAAQAMAEQASTAALDGAYNIATDANVIGGQGDKIQGVGLPGVDEISALVKPSALIDIDLRKPEFQPILVRMENELLFDFNSAELTENAQKELSRVADFIRQVEDLEVTVEGHTDSIDTDEFNLQLSQKRAQAVADWFLETAAIDKSSINVKGYGETRPLVEQTGDKDLEKPNRRVEIRIQGKK